MNFFETIGYFVSGCVVTVVLIAAMIGLVQLFWRTNGPRR